VSEVIATSSWVPGEVVAGRYRLVAEVGRGAHGEVWRAEDLDAEGATVAIKALRDAPSEADGVAYDALEHPHLLRHHGVITHEGRTGLVTEFADGGDVSQLLTAHPQGLPPGDVLTIVQAVVEALLYLHRRGIVHGDVKPMNLLIVNGKVKLGDIGLSRPVEEEAPGGPVLATPLYAAPELWRAEPATPAVDTYALGVAVFELLTGVPPFLGEPEALRHAHLHDAPPRLPSIEETWAELIRGCLAKDPGSRLSLEVLYQQHLAAQLGSPVSPGLRRPPAAPPTPEEQEALFAEGQAMFGQQRYAEGRRRLERLVALDHPAALHLMARAHREGLGSPVSLPDAIHCCLLAARRGHAEAQLELGVRHTGGDGVARDLAAASEWLRAAASQGLPDALYRVGRMRLTGLDGPPDPVEAAGCFRAAAARGHLEASFELAELLVRGRGVPQDPVEAVRWYAQAAEQGHAGAQCNLGWAYERGEGVSADPAEAVRWYEQAANQGLAAAQYNMGVACEEGFGVRRSLPQAVYWYRKAADQDHPDALFNLGLLTHRGEGGLRADEARAMELYRRALALGGAHASDYGALVSEVADSPAAEATDG
jgi:hypothetical protein